ncbi:hypothetical protein [Chrysiogenes arsenatis]|uniref:hypothetical protein n=1 Tax=Chrysiogenes arsenatis TaxID=309797 RepID=UPI00041DDDF2|nr:hypothetical protein [Chrysiogenes arsenatis]
MYELLLLFLALTCIFLIGITLYLLVVVRRIRNSLGGHSVYELEMLNNSLETLVQRADDSSLTLTEEIKREEFILKELLNLIDKRKRELEDLIANYDQHKQTGSKEQEKDIRSDVLFYLEKGFTSKEIAEKLGKPVSEISLLCKILSQNKITV